MSTLARYGRTLAAAFSPAATSPAFARTQLGPALRFFLLSALPLTLLSGIFPHTRTLYFEGAMQVRLVGDPSHAQLALDIARAMVAQLWLHGAQLLAFLLPYRSLTGAYAGVERQPFAVRTVLYRAWLLPAAELATFVAFAVSPLGGDPPSLPALVVSALFIVQLGATVLFIMSMTYSARLASGLSALWSVIVVGVALTVAIFGAWAAHAVLIQVLPPMDGYS